MTKLDAVIERLRALPPEDQDRVADEIEAVLEDDLDVALEDIAEALRRSQGPDDFASPDEVDSFFKRLTT